LIYGIRRKISSTSWRSGRIAGYNYIIIKKLRIGSGTVTVYSVNIDVVLTPISKRSWHINTISVIPGNSIKIIYIRPKNISRKSTGKYSPAFPGSIIKININRNTRSIGIKSPAGKMRTVDELNLAQRNPVRRRRSDTGYNQDICRYEGVN
jgi:hypothetical protein